VGSDAVVICDWVDLPAIGVGRIVGEVPENPPFFDLDYLLDAIYQAKLMGVSYVGLSLSPLHPRNGSRCLVLSSPSSDRAVVLAGFTPDDVEGAREAARVAAESRRDD
jgi:hypothetical protein